MENNNRTSGSDRTPASKFEKLLKKPIKTKKDYFDYVKALYDEWLIWHRGYEKLKQQIYPSLRKHEVEFYKKMNPIPPPQFFTGKIDSKVVMISLNGHTGEKKKNSEVDVTQYCKTFDEYCKFWTNFPRKRYTWKCFKNMDNSSFDSKLHYFLCENDCDVNSSKEVPSKKLAKWNFFHMELYPIPSSSYPISHKKDYIKPYLLRALDAIALYPRDLILILNRKVCYILDLLIDEKDLFIVKKNLFDSKKLAGCNFYASRVDYEMYHKKSKVKQPFKIVSLPSFANYQIYNNDKLLKEYYDYAFPKNTSKSERDLLKKAIGIK